MRDESFSSQADASDHNLLERESSKSPNQEIEADQPKTAICRTDSVNTHRSQSSSWEAQEAEGDDYAVVMLAKVLRSKYPPEEGETPFVLPIKRAFSKLDWTSRGWLLKDAVTYSCCAAASRAGWTFDLAVVTQIVM